MNYRIIYKDELYHHGIKGQKWGQRNGPPYPLGVSDHSAREQKAGWRSSLSSSKNEYKRAKTNAKIARNKRNRAYDEASNFSSLHPISQFVKSSKNYRKSNDLWNNAKQKDIAYDDAVKKLNAAKGDYKSAKSEYNNKRIANVLGISEKEAQQIKKYAKIVGISLATTAGLVAAGYLISRNRHTLSAVAKSTIEKGKEALAKTGLVKGIDPSQVVTGINKSGASTTYKLASKGLFANGDNIGSLAQKHGYKRVSADFIKEAINNPKIHPDVDALVRSVRLDQVSIFSGTRRLSCWSTAQSYYLSSLTGKNFCSMSFENLVDFNDFKTLYKTQPKIFDAFGKEAADFVGKFGRGEGRIRFTEDAGKALVSNLFKNTHSANNLTADGKKTVGFINAAYRGMTCTHQWNYEIAKGAGGKRILTIVDGYAGERYPVASQAIDGSINFLKNNNNNGFSKFMEELYHYNVDSLRFYAPDLSSIDPEALSKIILGMK